MADSENLLMQRSILVETLQKASKLDTGFSFPFTNHVYIFASTAIAQIDKELEK